MAEKKYKGRKAYLNDFKKDKKGNYEYQGEFYQWKGDQPSLRKELILLWIICIAMLAALTIAGCVDAPGAMNSFYVVLPYAISFVFGISTAWGLWRLFEGGNPLRAYIYQASVEQIPFRCVGTIIGAGVAILGEIVFLFKNGFNGEIGESLCFLLLEGVAVVMAVILRHRVIGMSWERKRKIDKL